MHTLPAFSDRIPDLHPSPIRDILAAASRPGMISFAGGLPAQETFPQFTLDAPPAALQYGATEGDTALRERIAGELQAQGLACTPAQILVLSGSQQGIDLVAKLFIDRETRVAVESPTYLAALQVFRFFGASFVPYSADDCRPLSNSTHSPAFAYVIPTFQNPTGHCYTDEQRARFAACCDAAELPVFEDDPYRDLAYEPCNRTPICAHLEKAPWIYQGSFSKSLAPGLRLGFLAASPGLIPYLTRLKQAADLHSNRLSQWLVLQALESPDRQKRLDDLVNVYRTKRDAFAHALTQHFGDLAHWETPRGGLFFWLKLKHAIPSAKLLESALAQGVAFMPGDAFYPVPQHAPPALRLNFSHPSIADAARGLSTLSSLFRAAIPSA